MLEFKHLCGFLHFLFQLFDKLQLFLLGQLLSVGFLGNGLLCGDFQDLSDVLADSFRDDTVLFVEFKL